MKRFEIWLINLNPTIGSEIAKTRPCVVVSPDVMNKMLNTVLVAPLTSTIKNYPTRVNCSVNGQTGQIALDQIRAVDKIRLIKKLDQLDKPTSEELCDVLVEMFEY